MYSAFDAGDGESAPPTTGSAAIAVHLVRQRLHPQAEVGHDVGLLRQFILQSISFSGHDP